MLLTFPVINGSELKFDYYDLHLETRFTYYINMTKNKKKLKYSTFIYGFSRKYLMCALFSHLLSYIASGYIFIEIPHCAVVCIR